MAPIPDVPISAAEATAAFAALPASERVGVLARLAHALTIAARDTYEPGTASVLRPGELRAWNEAQHRVTSALASHLDGGNGAWPAGSIVEAFFGFGDTLDPEALAWAWRQAWSAVSGHQ